MIGVPVAKKPDDSYTAEESKQRMEAALRGARISGHKPMKDVPKKREKPQLGSIERKAK